MSEYYWINKSFYLGYVKLQLIGYLLMEVFKCEILCAKAQIAWLVEPYCEWLPVSNQKPLANIKFSVVHKEWTLCKKIGIGIIPQKGNNLMFH